MSGSRDEFDDSYFLDLINQNNFAALTSNLDRDIVFYGNKSLLLEPVQPPCSSSSSSANSSGPSSRTDSSVHQTSSQHIENDDATDGNISESDIPSYIKRARAEVNDDPEGVIYIDSSDSESEQEQEEEEEEEGEFSYDSSDESSSYYSACDDIQETLQSTSISSPTPEHDYVDLTYDSDDDNDCTFVREVLPSPLAAEEVNARIIKMPHASQKILQEELKRQRQQPQQAKQTHSAQQQQYLYNSPLPTPFTGQVESYSKKRARASTTKPIKKQKVSKSHVKVRPVKKSVHIPSLTKRKLKINGIPYTDDLPLLNCIRCKVELTGTQKHRQLQQVVPASQGLFYCLGCARFLSLAADHQERDDMILWVLSGKVPKYDRPQAMTEYEVVTRLTGKHRQMRDRQRKGGSNDSNFLTLEQLMMLVCQSDYKCCITGCEILFHDTGLRRLPYWALTVDHKIALTLAKYEPGVWSISNMQIMSHALNHVKGHYDDSELQAWFNRFKAAHYVVLED